MKKRTIVFNEQIRHAISINHTATHGVVDIHDLKEAIPIGSKATVADLKNIRRKANVSLHFGSVHDLEKVIGSLVDLRNDMKRNKIGVEIPEPKVAKSIEDSFNEFFKSFGIKVDTQKLTPEDIIRTTRLIARKAKGRTVSAEDGTLRSVLASNRETNRLMIQLLGELKKFGETKEVGKPEPAMS